MSGYINTILPNWMTKPFVPVTTPNVQPQVTVEQTPQPIIQEPVEQTQPQPRPQVELAPTELSELQTQQTLEDTTVRNLMSQPQILSGLLNQHMQIASEEEFKVDIQPLTQQNPIQSTTTDKQDTKLERVVKGHVEQETKKLQQVESEITPSMKAIKKLQVKSKKIEEKLETGNLSKKDTKKLERKLKKMEKKIHRESTASNNPAQEKIKLQEKIEKHHVREAHKPVKNTAKK